MKITKFTVAFDNGDRIDVQAAARDLLALERAGVDLEAVPGIEGSYRIAHTALLRLERTGKIDPSEPIPETWEAFADVADLEEAEDEGEASGQAVSTG